MDTVCILLPLNYTQQSMAHTRKNKSLHVALRNDLKDKLADFAKARHTDMTKVLNYAFEKLLEEEEIDPSVETVLKDIILRKFVIPKGYKLRSFYLTLWLLASKYPEASSKLFWGELVFLSSMDKTHKEVFTEITEERKILSARKTKEGDVPPAA